MRTLSIYSMVPMFRIASVPFSRENRQIGCPVRDNHITAYFFPISGLFQLKISIFRIFLKCHFGMGRVAKTLKLRGFSHIYLALIFIHRLKTKPAKICAEILFASLSRPLFSNFPYFTRCSSKFSPNFPFSCSHRKTTFFLRKNSSAKSRFSRSERSRIFYVRKLPLVIF